jgi:hypothetical protein
MTKKPSPLQAARTRVAAELELPDDDWRVVRLAALEVAYDGVQATLATGNPRDADIDALLKLDMQIEAVRKEAGLSAKPIALRVTYVHPTTKCPGCGNEFSLDLPDDDSSGSPVQAASSKPVAEPASPLPTPALAVQGSAASPQPNVVPLDPAQRAAELRTAARTTGGITPPVQTPRVNYNFPDNESPAALSRRISESYR